MQLYYANIYIIYHFLTEEKNSNLRLKVIYNFSCILNTDTPIPCHINVNPDKAVSSTIIRYAYIYTYIQPQCLY